MAETSADQDPPRPLPPDPTPWPGLTALVLGGTGAIGHHLTAALLRRGTRVRLLLRPGRQRKWLPPEVEPCAGDLEDPASLERALRGCDLLFHCAAPYPRSHFRQEAQVAHALRQTSAILACARRCVPAELLALPRGHLRLQEVEQAEFAATTLRLQPERARELRQQVRSPALLEAALRGELNASLQPPLAESASLPGLKRLVFVSSITTIGRPHGRDPAAPGSFPAWANEDDRMDLIHGSSPYFRMKAEMEALVTREAVEGLPAIIVNPTLCVDTHDALPTSGKLLCAVARREMPAYLPGVLNAVATRDVAEGMVLACARGRTGRRYILGHENLSAREFIGLIAGIAGVPEPKFALPLPLAAALAWMTEVANLLAPRSWPLLPLSGVQMIRFSQPVDCSRARRELGMPQTPIRTAVAEALQWFRENGYLKH